MMIKNILILLLLVTAIGVSAQTEIIPEENVDLNIQKWFYSQYPKSTEVIWSKVRSAAAKERVQVQFLFEQQSMLAVYNVEGERILENRNVKEPHISLVNYVHENYDKAKIKSVKKTTDFVSDKIMYEMNVKSKSKGLESLAFDEDYNPIPTDFITSSN